MKTYQTCTELLQIAKGDVVSITGAGGKTSLLFLLGRELGRAGRSVLLTTTTKMREPESDQCDFVELHDRAFQDVELPKAGRYFAACPTQIPGKLGSLSAETLEALKERFDVTVIEADGAAMKRLKGWKDFEPVIPAYTTLTVGVLDITCVGRTITSDLVHRLELFTQITGAQEGEKVTLDHLERMIRSPRGLFQHARGRKMLFVNKVESEEGRKHCSMLQTRLADTLPVGGGSVRDGVFYG